MKLKTKVVLYLKPDIPCTQQNKYIWKILQINFRTLGLRGGFFVSMFYAENQIFARYIPLNTSKHNVCSTKLEKKMLCL